MHPDEATGEIIRYAGVFGIPYAVVPCCIVGKDSLGVSNFQDWLNRLKSIATKGNLTFHEYTLKMSGKNIVIFGSPTRKVINHETIQPRQGEGRPSIHPGRSCGYTRY